MRKLCYLVQLSLLIAALGTPAWAGWIDWPGQNLPLCSAVRNQTAPAVCSDGAGGAIVAWEDDRGGTADVYAQRVSADGAPLWTANGVPICTAPQFQDRVAIMSDGAGGAIIAWHDYRNANSDIYAQRINASGEPQWAANGAAVCADPGDERDPALVSDGAGGVIVIWEDWRATPDWDVYAQRLDARGALLWTPNGVPVCNAQDNQVEPSLVSDGVGGVIVGWGDYRSGTGRRIYGQRVSSVGVPQWAMNGIPLCPAPGDQYGPQLAPDGAGGALVAWTDNRSGTRYTSFAQRINAAGTPLWSLNGAALVTSAVDRSVTATTSDGVGGAIVTLSSGNNDTIGFYAQRIDATGTPRWLAGGTPLCNAAGIRVSLLMVSDGAGGAIATWGDLRNGIDYDIYAQRINAQGVSQWTLDGVVLCNAASNQFTPTVTGDGAGGAIVAWSDLRSGNGDIYAQRVDGAGSLGVNPSATIADVRDTPDDQGGWVRVHFPRSALDFPGAFVPIISYYIWERIRICFAPLRA